MPSLPKILSLMYPRIIYTKYHTWICLYSTYIYFAQNIATKWIGPFFYIRVHIYNIMVQFRVYLYCFVMGFVKLCTILLICRSSKLTEIKLMCNNSCTKIFTPKVCHQGAICWSKKELFWPYGLDHIFFRNETFLLFNIDS